MISLSSLHSIHQYYQHFYGNAMLKTTAQCFIMCTQLQCPYLHIHFLQIVLLYTENVPAFTYSNLRSTILEINCSLSTSVIIYPFFVYTCDCQCFKYIFSQFKIKASVIEMTNRLLIVRNCINDILLRARYKRYTSVRCVMTKNIVNRILVS